MVCVLLLSVARRRVVSLFACAVLPVQSSAHARSIAAALDGTLEVIDGPRLSLAVCRVDAAHPDPQAMAKWIAALHAAIDIIPMQFGDRVEHAAEAIELLSRREAQLLITLDAIRGHTEFGLRLLYEDVSVRVTPPRESIVANGSGRGGAAYLHTRADHYAALDGLPNGLSTRVERWLAELDVPGLRARLEGPSPLIRHPAVHMLVARGQAARLVERCTLLAERLAYRASLSGPWAPFNFVSGINVGG